MPSRDPKELVATFPEVPLSKTHRRLRRGAPCSSAIVAGLLAVLSAVWLPAPASAQIPQPTLTSQPAAPRPAPGGNFEASVAAVPSHAYAPAWAPWVMTAATGGPPVVAGSGIARNGAPFLAQSDPAPQGACVMFVEGTGTSYQDTVLTPGLWRLRFQAAQRAVGVPAVPDRQVLKVTINGSTVFEAPPGAHFQEYYTGTYRVVTGGTMRIEFTGLGAAGQVALLDQIRVQAVLDWADPATWRDPNGAVPALPPGAADHVLVPAGSAVAIGGRRVAATVEVTGDLVAEHVDGALVSAWVLVHTAGAHFEVGLAAHTFPADFALTLIGQPGAPTIPGHGTKFLIAMDGGRIDMHGTPKTSWTKLTSLSGATIRVLDRRGWQVGDQVLLVASKWMSSIDTAQEQRSEVRAITAINPTTGDITLASAPAEFHCAAAPTTYTNPQGSASWVVDERAEVGMLSHNVRVQGDPLDSTPTNLFGAHVMMMNGTCCATPGTGYFANVQFTHMGQRSPQLPIADALGRYPLHWHMQKAAGQGQYARGCSVWQSFNRAITIHGTDGLLLEDNVLFDHDGHGVFFEDGGERNNRILRNLVVLTRRPPDHTQLLPHDNSHAEVQNQTPAAFWITNPQNEFVGNVAAHTVGTGYWFALHARPTGSSFGDPYFNDPVTGQPIDPRKLPIIAFRDNVAHGCMSGLDVNDMIDDHGTHTGPGSPGTLDDTILTNISWDPPAPTDLLNFTAYGCSLAIYSGLGTGNTYNDLLTFRNAVLADNETHIQLASAITVTESLLVENTGSGVFRPAGGPMLVRPGWFPHPGYAYTAYDGPGRLMNSHLVGFDGSGHPKATLAMSHFGAARRHPNHVMSGLTFQNGALPQILFYDFTPPPPHSSMENAELWGIVIKDLDGSLSNGAYLRRSLITNHPMLHLTNGAATPDVAVPNGVNAWLSPFSWGHLTVTHWQQMPGGWWQLLGGGQPGLPLPPASFKRDVYQGWPGCLYQSKPDGNQVRQVPILMRPASTPTAPVCDYSVALEHPATTAVNTRRVDLAVDDTLRGAVVRLRVSNAPAWSNPAVYLNDANDPNPANWTLLTPVAVAVLDQQTATACARPTPGDVLLRTVNTGRRHQITILW